MDFLFIAGIALLWGALVLMAWGLEKLASPQGERK